MDKSMLPHDGLTQTCHLMVKELESLEVEMRNRIETITKEEKQLADKLQKLAASKAVKINLKEKAAFENECAHYIKALDKLIETIKARLIEWRQKLLPENSPASAKNDQELIQHYIYIHHHSRETKKFIKKIKKDVAVIHSRFSFRFEVQRNNLAALEAYTKRG